MTELKFASVEQALQHLANFTGKRVKIANHPFDDDPTLKNRLFEAAVKYARSFGKNVFPDGKNGRYDESYVYQMMNQDAYADVMESVGMEVPEELDDRTQEVFAEAEKRVFGKVVCG